MKKECLYSRQIESYLDCKKEEKIPKFLNDHYQSCFQCREQFMQVGKIFEKVESFIPHFTKNDTQLGKDAFFLLLKEFPFKIVKKEKKNFEGNIFQLRFLQQASLEFLSVLRKKRTFFPVFFLSSLLICLFIWD